MDSDSRERLVRCAIALEAEVIVNRSRRTLVVASLQPRNADLGTHCSLCESAEKEQSYDTTDFL